MNDNFIIRIRLWMGKKMNSFALLKGFCALSQPGILQSFGKDEEVETLSCLVSGMTGLELPTKEKTSRIMHFKNSLFNGQGQ